MVPAAGRRGETRRGGNTKVQGIIFNPQKYFFFLAPALTIDVDISYVFIMECLHEKSVMSGGLGCLLYCVWTGGWCPHRMLLCVSSILLSPHQPAAGLGWAGLGWAGLGQGDAKTNIAAVIFLQPGPRVLVIPRHQMQTQGQSV